LWTDGGVHVARVLEVEVPQSIATTDTLRLQLWARLEQPTGRPEFSHFETVRSEHRLELTVWARVDLWRGDGPMPPTDLTVLYGETYSEPPPFSPGEFEILIAQPDGTTLTAEVMVTDG
jgi:hypothetical protein